MSLPLSLDLIAAHANARGVAPADPLRQPLDQARALATSYQAIWNETLPAVARRLDASFADRHGRTIRVRLFSDHPGTAAAPALVYFHGGGFVLNSIDTHERLLRLLAARSGVTVIAVAYDLAPETRFPGQLHQALDAMAWLRAHGRALGIDPRRLAVGGDSAGATLALSLTLALRDQGLPLPAFGLLLYGMFSARLDTPSHQSFGTGAHGLTTERVDWFWTQYLAGADQRGHPLAAPLLADLTGLPHQHIIAAGLDCLLDDSIALAARLTEAKVPHRLSIHRDVPHSFMQMSAVLPAADAAISEAARAVAAVW